MTRDLWLEKSLGEVVGLMLKVKKKIKNKRKTTVKAKAVSPEDKVFPNKEELLVFLNRMTKWLEDPLNYRKAIYILTQFDSNGDNKLSSNDFTVALKMAEIPATRLELKCLVMVTNLEDKDDKKVDISLFFHLLVASKHELEHEQESDSESNHTDYTLSIGGASKKCSHCEIRMAGPPLEIQPKYIKLKLILAPFKTFTSHLGHFEQLVTESMTVHGLKSIIQNHLEEAVTSVAVFTDETCNKESFMDPMSNLTNYDIKGGSKAEPVFAELFYDYFPVLHSCPILLDDSHMTVT